MLSTINFSEDYSLLNETLFFEKLEAKIPFKSEEKLNAIATILLQSYAALEDFRNREFGDLFSGARNFEDLTDLGFFTLIDIAATQASIIESFKAVNEAKTKLKGIKEKKLDLSKDYIFENLLEFSYVPLKGERKKIAAKQMEIGSIQQTITNIQQGNLKKRQEIVSNPNLDVSLSRNMCMIIKSYILNKATRNKLAIKGIEAPAILGRIAPLLRKSLNKMLL